MGMVSILGTLLKNVSWLKVASMAVEHGPELFRKAKERFQSEGEAADETPVEIALHEKISRLEKLLLEQETVIRNQAAKNSALQEQSASLESRLFTFKIICGALFLATLTCLSSC